MDSEDVVPLLARIREPANRLVASLRVAAPPTLYHYTDLKGATGILGSGSLWATDIRFLNDAKEFALTLDLATDQIDTQMVRADDPDDRTMLEALREYISEEIATATYVLSFTERRDDLSQWRAYGGRGGALSLGFETDHLNRAAQRQGFFLHSVAYESRHQEAVVDEILRDVVPVWRKVRDYFNGTDKAEEAANAATMMICQRVGGALEAVAPVLKHSSFRAEGEWRYIAAAQFIEYLQDPGFAAKYPHRFEVQELTPRFRTTDWGIVPYVEVDVRDRTGMGSLTEVVLGPNPDFFAPEAGVRRLIGCSEFNVGAVERSGCPFRKW